MPVVDVGQHDVQDQQIVLSLYRQVFAVDSVASNVHDEAVFAQALVQSASCARLPLPEFPCCSGIGLWSLASADDSDVPERALAFIGLFW